MIKIKMYGSRGTMPLSNATHREYGGNTSCVALDIDGYRLVLDCGTGLVQFYNDNREYLDSGGRLDILLSHLHLDHIIGLSLFPPVLSPDSDLRIFTRSRNEQPLVSQIFGIFTPPYWPVKVAEVTKVKAVEIIDESPFTTGNGVVVTPFFTDKHDFTAAFRIDTGIYVNAGDAGKPGDAGKTGDANNTRKSVVYLLDYEIRENMNRYDSLIRFCRNADLIIFDAAYLPDDYPAKRGWGHSTYEDGIALAEASGCGKMIFSHISQVYTDRELNSLGKKLDKSRFVIAYDGMELTI